MSPSRVSPPPPSDLSNGLTPEQLEFWNEKGYLLIPDALSKDTTEGLLADAYKLLNDFSLDDHPMTKFSTGEKSDHVGDDYFLESGDKVRFFFEEGKHHSQTQAKSKYATTDSKPHRRLRRRRAPDKAQRTRHKQNRPLPPPPTPLIRRRLPLPPERQHSPLPRLPRPPRPPINDNLQTTRDRRPSTTPPRQHLPVHRPALSSRILVRP